jgi:hypothetical protein
VDGRLSRRQATTGRAGGGNLAAASCARFSRAADAQTKRKKPQFFGEYSRARMIIDLGTRHAGDTPAPPPPQAQAQRHLHVTFRLHLR